MSGPPRLSVSTGLPPSTPASSLRRPQGARKRVQGLFVANPDNSDSDVSPRSSPVRGSPVTASGSTFRGTSGLQYSGQSPSAPRPTGQLPSPALPSIPAPNTPHAFPSPHPTPPSASSSKISSFTPPQPPPQPERHNHRAYTTSVAIPEHPSRPHDTRHASLGGMAGRHPPNSPTRHLPALPSPPIATSPSPGSSHTPSLYSHAEASGSRPHLQHLHTLLKTNSPDDMMSPAAASDHSLASLSSESGTRPRSGSVHNPKRLLQVTMDNESFTLVDITGMHTAEAIMERVFSKLRFRDDEYATLSLYRTEIGDLPAGAPMSRDGLLALCQEQGDARASLKFLVLQTGIPGSAASIVPPTEDRQLPPIDTGVRSKDGSLHSASGSSVGEERSGSGLQRKHNIRHERRLPSASSSSRSLNQFDRDSGASSPRSNEAPRSSAMPVAGPSRQEGLGLFTDDGMDPETRALIEQMQREEDEDARQQEQNRRRQLEADERLARNEQQQERDVWQAMQAMQLETRRREQEQIEQDAQRAREVQEEEQREDDRQREASRRDSHNRNATFVNDRRAVRQEWMHRDHESWTLPAVGDARYSDRRPSDTPPYIPINRDRQVYTSPQAQFAPEVPNVYLRQPSRQSSGRYEEEDYRLRPGASGTQQRQPTRHPYGYPDGYALQNARSMDNLRPYDPPVSRPPYQAGARPTHTPQSTLNYRSPSTDRAQDGRYPEPTHIGSVPFPSPRPRRQDSGEQSWLPYATSPRDFHYDQRNPPPTSPSTSTLPQRPSTLYNESPPQTARADAYFPPYSNSRRNSVDHIPRGKTPLEEGSRRASESSAGDPRESTPYLDSDPTWFRSRGAVEGSGSSTVSSARSEATVRAAGTLRPDDLQAQWRAMVDKGPGGTLMPPARDLALAADDDDEATLWITAPNTRTDSPRDRSPSRPNVTISTLGRTQPDPSLTSASDSNTESETEEGQRMQRNKSFAKPRDQWYFRPEPEQLYANLDALFPKIDLDKPFVEGSSTPTTPNEVAANPPPPPRESRLSPKTDKHDKSTAAALMSTAFMGRFNKGENRKSIRVVADFARRAIARDNKKAEPASLAVDMLKLERRKSSSMWGHQVVEVTPSRIAGGHPTPIPESPSAEAQAEADGKPPILNWVKGELIGKGSYGRVYIALNVTTGDMMAVKQVELPATDRDRQDHRQLSMVEALSREIALLKDLYHANIVQYLGTETSQEYISIFLEYVPGGTIASIYRQPGQSPFEEQLVKFFTKQILDGLAYLHTKQILHRDLKGDNILVDASGVCKISDFGISKQASDAYDSFGQATNMKGSVFWMAPEMIHSADERTYSGKVDIWSLGCVVMEMWTGQRPWGTMEQVHAMYELFNGRTRPPLPSDVSSQLSDVALDFLNERCLAKDPHDRPTAKELLQHRFILETDPSWTFPDSRIGKAVASRGARKMKAHHAAHASTG